MAEAAIVLERKSDNESDSSKKIPKKKSTNKSSSKSTKVSKDEQVSWEVLEDRLNKKFEKTLFWIF